MRTRLHPVVPFAVFAFMLLAQADMRDPRATATQAFSPAVVEGVRPTPRFLRAARAPLIPTKTTVPVRRDFRARVIASAGAL